ncbi:hypothetical protein CUR178_05192 [Leishmania enriettii]|uniref:Histone RNA hairpin-binding protein RNA-binding domain-containing protein n=1 Tax=Leishmania enriettii TaxID=5663 RepID=A0A836KTC1_LEIEN|nr:hypothetical protein CUR178_05192 [Leishmania enriettii]
MQPQQQQSVATPQRTPQGGNHGGDVSMCVGQTPDNVRALLQGSPSRSPAPRFPSEGIFPSALQQPQQDNEHTSVSSIHPRSPSSQPREPSHAPQRPHQQKQQQPNPSYGPRSQRGDGERDGSGSGNCNDWRQGTVPCDSNAPLSGASSRRRKSTSPGTSPDEERRRSQREKQIQFGYATDGYTNMKRLIAHDPLLRSGGLLPLSPPEIVKGSKRMWDIQLRKWRRALHMFDYVFIDGEDDQATRATVLEEQRQQWISEAFNEMPREARVKIDLDTLRRVQHSSAVPRKIPVEGDLRCILRSNDCYESVRSVVPQSASSLTKGTDISPLEAGIKIHIAPSAAVLQRQQAQVELLQRLSSLHQQQQQQQQQILATEATLKDIEAGSHDTSAPPVQGKTVERAPAQQPAELSPSPRRPPLPPQSATHLSWPSQSQWSCDMTPHQQRSDNPKRKQSGSTLRGCSFPCSTATPASTAFSSAETAPGLSASQHRVPSPSGSSAPVWGASQGMPGVPSAVAVLAPPPPFASALPCTAPSTWMPRVGVSPTQAAAAVGSAAVATAPPLMSPCGHCVNLPPHVITGAPYGGVWAGSIGICAGMPVPAPAPPHHVNPASTGGTCRVMVSPPTQIPGTTPCMSRSTASIAAAGITSPAYWQMPAPPMVERMMRRGTVAAHHDMCHSQYRQFEAQQEAFTAMPTPTVAAAGRSCPREGRHRSSGAAATGGGATTPLTVPRFVARVSTSPNEQRLGERHPAERLHIAGVASGGVPEAMKPLATETRETAVTSTVPQQLSLALKDAAATAERLERSQPVLTVTPERTLFGISITAEVATEARPVVTGAQQQPEARLQTPSGKPRSMPEVEGAPVAPLVFDDEA